MPSTPTRSVNDSSNCTHPSLGPPPLRFSSTDTPSSSVACIASAIATVPPSTKLKGTGPASLLASQELNDLLLARGIWFHAYVPGETFFVVGGSSKFNARSQAAQAVLRQIEEPLQEALGCKGWYAGSCVAVTSQQVQRRYTKEEIEQHEIVTKLGGSRIYKPGAVCEDSDGRDVVICEAFWYKREDHTNKERFILCAQDSMKLYIEITLLQVTPLRLLIQIYTANNPFTPAQEAVVEAGVFPSFYVSGEEVGLAKGPVLLLSKEGSEEIFKAVIRGQKKDMMNEEQQEDDDDDDKDSEEDNKED